MSVAVVIFLLHGLFVDEDIPCNRLGAECEREEYHQFLDDEVNPPTNYTPCPEEEPLEESEEEDPVFVEHFGHNFDFQWLSLESTFMSLYPIGTRPVSPQT